MTNPLQNIANLRLLIADMEKELGLSDHSHLNRSLIAAVSDICSELDGKAPTSKILEHKLLSEFSRPSIFRALKEVEKSGKINKVGNVRGFYAVNLPA